MQTVSDTLPAAAAEAAEAEFMYQLGVHSPRDTADELGISATRLGGGIMLAMARDPSGYWNKALGFGFTEPVTADLVDRVLDTYRSAGSPTATIQLAPSVLPADWERIRAARGIQRGGSIIKSACRIEDVKRAAGTTLRVGEIAVGDAGQWADVMLGAFGMPLGSLSTVLAGIVGKPGFRSYGAWDGDRLVAVGNLYVHGAVGALHSGATLPSHRGLGAQSALIAARAEGARQAGCRWLITETGNPGPGEHNSSLANMARAGLTPQYVRHNWRWQNNA